MLSRTECLEYMARIGMPCHIRRHSMLVAEVALLLGGLLNKNGTRLDLKLIENGALLHDVGKEPTFGTGKDHAAVGAEMLAEIVSPEATRIVREHIFLEPDHVEGPLNESLLVNYSDKRVMHDRVVSVQTRFEDLVARYTSTPVQRGRLLKKMDLYLELEDKIFTHLSIDPQGPEIMGIKLVNTDEAGGANYGRQADRGTIGGGEVC